MSTAPRHFEIGQKVWYRGQWVDIFALRGHVENVIGDLEVGVRLENGNYALARRGFIRPYELGRGPATDEEKTWQCCMCHEVHDLSVRHEVDGEVRQRWCSGCRKSVEVAAAHSRERGAWTRTRTDQFNDDTGGNRHD